MKKVYTLLLIVGLNTILFAQDKINPNGYNQFYYENGKLSSEGFMRNGKPDGYWKTYNEKGFIKSEGNRKDFKLDSIWTFYSDSGKVILKITYLEGKKNGIRTTYSEDEIYEENFVNDVKQGFSYTYYPDGKLWKEANFIDGLEEGTGKEFAYNDGRVIKLITYKKGYITDIENINRIDKANMKQGKWVNFYEEGNVKWEGEFKNDLKNGYFKEYSKEGNLLTTQKYIDGILQEEVEELAKLDIKTEYYPTGKPKIVASYKNNIPEGVRREYSPDGKIAAGYIFKTGILVGEGIVNEAGMKDGSWKEFYANGTIKNIGVYDKGKRIGEWKFYHPNGQLEQIGSYNKEGKEDGTWTWYYAIGSLLREESYINGKLDGQSIEYDESGIIIAEGEYIEDYREGKWMFNYGDQLSEEEYLNGMLNGQVINYYKDGVMSFEGKFIEDNPNGHHIWYYPNGNKKTEGDYLMGLKNGEWIKYNLDGSPFISIFYENGVEKKYDGIRVRIYDEDETGSSQGNNGI
jgi:antitoxin component YwqK of YwqJK toxin-antitoxin module